MREDTGPALPWDPGAMRRVRRRVLATCVGLGLAAIAALMGTGLAFRRVLRAKSRESCVRVADLFAIDARRRLQGSVAEAAALARELAEAPLPVDRLAAPLDLPCLQRYRQSNNRSLQEMPGQGNCCQEAHYQCQDPGRCS